MVDISGIRSDGGEGASSRTSSTEENAGHALGGRYELSVFIPVEIHKSAC